MVTEEEEALAWHETCRKIRKEQLRNYLNPGVPTTTVAPDLTNDEGTTTYDIDQNREYSLTPENRHERRKAKALARKKRNKVRSNHANNRINRKGRKR